MNVKTPDPEWIDAKEVQRRFSIGRTTLYGLLAEGRIKSSLIRRRGNVKGRRLFSFDSIKAIVESSIQCPAEAADEALAAVAEKGGSE